MGCPWRPSLPSLGDRRGPCPRRSPATADATPTIQARPVARHFDQRNAGIVDAGRRNAGKIDGLPAFDLVLDRTHAVARKAAFGSVDCQLAIIEFEQRQREVKPSRTEPWMAWSNPHAAVPPVQTLVSMIHRIRQAGWQLPVRRR